ncbi:MAG: acetyl-CoA carboxylase carboxyltransferase subunit alpha [Candidatus Omnitrophica bacterium CG1_02_49_10]|nr:MAG: acetyl-CoA carboxylase carboxyltransferase subunit alpha [Candidatus Omnitrophica bacterium CG1_02_49_10]
MTNATILDFEKPIFEMERKIEELRKFTASEHIDIKSEMRKLEEKLEKLKADTYGNLTPWQRIQIARHPKRPYTLDYISMLASDFVEIHGDRLFGDDRAMICGLGKISGRKTLIIGHQKGRDTKDNLSRNFGSAHPEGYRKAIRLMKMAEKFDVPIVIFIDTPGAYPGIGAEERGQAHSIAYNMREMMDIRVPIIIFVIGEGGSGGALGIGVGDKVCVFENAYYSVISPEGCAAILWKDRAKAPEAAEALKLTAKDLLKLGVIDAMVPEPLGGAHRDYEAMAETVKKYISDFLDEHSEVDRDKLIEKRYNKFRKMGIFEEE